MRKNITLEELGYNLLYEDQKHYVYEKVGRYYIDIDKRLGSVTAFEPLDEGFKRLKPSVLFYDEMVAVLNKVSEMTLKNSEG